MPKDHGIAASTKRREDVRFLTGRGAIPTTSTCKDRPMPVSCAAKWRMVG